ncbi:MAG: 2-methylcitrate dehydratase, partial [Thiohalomonadales bacterium]
DPAKRSISNAIQVFFKDAGATGRTEVEYPLGHKVRRKEALPLLQDKFYASVEQHYSQLKNPKLKKQQQNLFTDTQELREMTISDFMACFP